MATIGFIGLGNMGGGMAANLAAKGYAVRAFDLSQAALDRAVEAGCTRTGSSREAMEGVDAVVTMLPAGKHVRAVYADEVLGAAPASALLIDCSTIDVGSARAVGSQAAEAGYAMVDAPVSGGIAAANAGSLTFMVGGEADAFTRAEPILQAMGKAVIHAADRAADAGDARPVRGDHRALLHDRRLPQGGLTDGAHPPCGRGVTHLSCAPARKSREDPWNS